MFKPNSYLRLSDPLGVLAVNQSLIELSFNTVCYTTWDDCSHDGKIMQLVNITRESLRVIGSQLSSYLSWFVLPRLAQDVKQE